jgi:hypothetical protein
MANMMKLHSDSLADAPWARRALLARRRALASWRLASFPFAPSLFLDAPIPVQPPTPLQTGPLPAHSCTEREPNSSYISVPCAQ